MHILKHLHKSELFGNHVLWLDEETTTKKNSGNNSAGGIWRKNVCFYKSQNTKPTVKHCGGSIMACMELLLCTHFRGITHHLPRKWIWGDDSCFNKMTMSNIQPKYLNKALHGLDCLLTWNLMEDLWRILKLWAHHRDLQNLVELKTVW